MPSPPSCRGCHERHRGDRHGPVLKTIPTGLLAFSSRYVTDYRLLFSALTIITLPMVAVYVIFHRQVVAGVTEGSLK